MENNTLLDDSWDVVSFSSESVTIDVLMKVGTWYTFKVCLSFYVNLYFYFNNVCLKTMCIVITALNKIIFLLYCLLF